MKKIIITLIILSILMFVIYSLIHYGGSGLGIFFRPK